MLRTNILIALVVALLLGLNVGVYSDQAAIDRQATIDKIESAYAQADAATLEELARTTDGYSRNLADYRLSTDYNFKDRKNAADEKIQLLGKHQ